MNLGTLGSMLVEVEATGISTARKGMEGVQAATKKAGDEAKRSVPVLEKMGKRWASVLTLVSVSGAAAFGLIAKSSPSVLAALKGIQFAFEDIFMTIGEELAPIFEFFESVLWKISDAFNGLSPTTKTFIAGLVGAIVVVGAIAAAVAGASYIVPLLSAAFAAAAAFVGVSVGTLLVIIGAVIIIVAALYAAWENNLFGIRDKVAIFVTWVKERWSSLMSILTDKNTTTWQKVKNVIGWAADTIIDILTTLWDTWKSNMFKTLEKATEIYTAIKDVIKNAVSDAYDSVVDYVGKIISKVSAAVSKIKSLYSSSSSSSSSSSGIDVPAGATYSISTGSFKAMGGGVLSGKSYLVGERGPELFTPANSGTVSNTGTTKNLLANAGSGTTELSMNQTIKLDGKTIWNSVKKYAAADLRRGGA